jgi:hypothetical protein
MIDTELSSALTQARSGLLLMAAARSAPARVEACGWLAAPARYVPGRRPPFVKDAWVAYLYAAADPLLPRCPHSPARRSASSSISSSVQ